jgi:hypothetical protein
MSDNPKSNPVEDELDAIRIKIYERTKDMSSAEQVEYFNRRTREAFAKYGIKSKIVSAPIVKREPGV